MWPRALIAHTTRCTFCRRIYYARHSAHTPHSTQKQPTQQKHTEHTRFTLAPGWVVEVKQLWHLRFVAVALTKQNKINYTAPKPKLNYPAASCMCESVCVCGAGEKLFN